MALVPASIKILFAALAFEPILTTCVPVALLVLATLVVLESVEVPVEPIPIEPVVPPWIAVELVVFVEPIVTAWTAAPVATFKVPAVAVVGPTLSVAVEELNAKKLTPPAVCN